jgi:hypothetical protein
MNYEPFTRIKNPTLAHFRHFSSLFTNLPLHLSRNLYKSILFMQNKPNVKDAQINVNSYMKSKYEKLDTWLSGKNKPNSNPIQTQFKPNSNPIKPNLKRAKMNVSSFITTDYSKNDDFAVRKNKPNSNPISKRYKMNLNSLITKGYRK